MEYAKSHIGRLLVALFLPLLLVGAFPADAFAWNLVKKSDTFTYYVNPTYQNFNRGMYNIMGNYFADNRAEMTVYCTSSSVPAGRMKAQGIVTCGTMFGEEENKFGVVVSNGSTMSQNAQLTGVAEQSISTLKGHVGSLAWGDGSVASNSGNWTNLKCDFLYLLTVDANGNFTPSPYSLGDEGQTFGTSNFVDPNGKVFGVPYVNDDGEYAVPDMLRTTLADGTIAYISFDEMRNLTNQAISQLDYEKESELLASEIESLSGVFEIPCDQARLILDEYKQNGGIDNAAVALETPSNDGWLIMPIDDDVIGSAIARVAAEQAVSIPAYSETGQVVGHLDMELI